MRHDNYYKILAVLCALQCIGANKQITYEYTSSATARNQASDVGISKWTISGELTVQHFDDYQIFQLDKLKTSVFNGLNTDKYPEEKDPIETKDDLKYPFTVYFNSLDDVEITVARNEPEWSKNMKRAIVSLFNVKKDAVDGYQGTEQTIYGNCEVKYEKDDLSDGRTISYFKTIDRTKCTNTTDVDYNNVEKIDLQNNHVTNQFSTKRMYQIKRKTNDLIYVSSVSNFTYQNMPGVRATHHLDTVQTFVERSIEENFTPIQIPYEEKSRITLLWDSDIDEDEEISQEEVFKRYNTALKKYKEKFHKRPLVNTDINDVNTMDNMYLALNDMKKEGIDKIIFNLWFDDSENQHILMSLLPYIGTETTTELIKKLIVDDELNDLLLIKLMATFPFYINDPNQKTLDQFTELMNLTKSNTAVQNAGILSYANLIADTYNRGEVELEFWDDIVTKYHNGLKHANDYEERMTYLLGLINMAEHLKEDRMLEIITDNNIEYNLRTLGIFGFKKSLSDPTDDNVYKKMWSIVQKSSENFEVRVAALDLLLSSNLSEEQFNTIVEAYEKKPENPYEEHLSNYVFTTLQALENSTGYSNYLADFATARLQKGHIPRYTRSWTTGNYRLAFSDDQANFGTSLQTRLIGYPISNAINIIHLSYDHFAMSLALESYTMYLKLGGVFDTIFVEAFLDSRTDAESSIQLLVDLIKNAGYKMKENEDIHIDLALFSKGKAVFGIHFDKNSMDTFSDSQLFLDLMKLMIYYHSITYPLIHFTKFPSDLGTAIEIVEEEEQIVYQEFDNFVDIADDNIIVKDLTYHYKSAYAYTESVSCSNPLSKTEITVYKYLTSDKSIDFPFRFDSDSYILSWKNHTDIFNWVGDHLLGTSIDEKEDGYFKQYCPTCNDTYAIPIGTHIEKDLEFTLIGINLFGTRTNNSEEQIKLNQMEPRRWDPVQHVQKTHRSNAFAFPPAKPFMYLWHLYYYLGTIHELDSYVVRTAPIYDEKYETVLNISLDGDSITRDNDPMDGSEIELNLSIKNQKPDGGIKNGMNTTLKITIGSKTSDDAVKPHFEHNLALYFDIVDDDNFTKICINREMLYPNKRSNKLSLKPVKPAKGKITIAWGSVETLSACPNNYIKFTELYTATEVQNRKAEEMAEYKQCKEDSVGFKYIPPTQACIDAHEAISKYDVYGIYADFKHAEIFKYLEEQLEKTKLGYKVLEYNHIDDSHINVSISHVFGDTFFDIRNTDLLDFEENSAFVDFMSVDPTAVAYDDYDLYAGLSSICVITPTTIQTFTGIHEPVFKEKTEEEIVAFVECFNKTKSMMKVKRINNKAIGFNWFTGNHVLVANNENGKLKLTVQDKEIHKTPEEQSEDLKIYFLEDDVIYATDDLVEVYYTTEYISIKAPSAYNNYICGKCSYEKK